jgi:hypothetical protein
MRITTAGLLTFVMLVATGILPGRARADEAAPLTSNGLATCAIVCDPANALSARSAARLADYLSEHAGAKPPVLAPSQLEKVDVHDTLILIDGGRDLPLLSKAGIKASIPDGRDDAYALKVVHRPNVAGQWVIAAAGRTPAGAKYATYRLMEEMQIDDGASGRAARIAALDVQARPFFPRRSVSLFNIWRVPVNVIRQCNLEAWPVEKVQRSIDTYDAFGFNAIETHDRFHEDFLKNVYGTTRAEWRDKVYAMCDRAHADGMTVFFRMWGNSVALPVKKLENGYTPFGFVNLAPDIPEERARWEREVRDYAATNYASHIDHLIGHWADAGGIHPGSDATVKDAMLLHNELVAAFRKINPKVQSTFNLWGMANPRGKRGWPGYVDHHSICDAGILPNDVCIAQTTRSHSHVYSEQVTRDILASGHPAAVWSWRRADTEVRFGDAGLRIRLHDLVGNYFHDLPESASQLAWHNIERNHHGIANDVNYYVAGKLMWDPKADVDALVKKYCQLVFGAANAEAVAEAFNTIEASRHIEQFVSDAVIAHPADAERRARAALEALLRIKLPDGHRSRLPSVVSPQEMLGELRATLSVIAENAKRISDNLPALDAKLKAGKLDEAKAQAAELEGKAKAWCETVAGGVEGAWLSQAVKQKLDGAKDVAAEPAEQHGLLTRDVASLRAIDAGKAPGGGGKAGFAISAQGEQPGVALSHLDPAVSGPIEFRVSLKSAGEGRNRNGGLVFGPSSATADLVRCQILLRGKRLKISGAGVKPARLDVPGMDPAAEQTLVVRVDPAKKRLTVSVGTASVETPLAGPKPIAYYGYIVEQATTDFGPIEVDRR